MNINYKTMKQICLSPISAFEPIGDVYETRDGIYVYKDNPKAKILAVAHLDSVLDLNHFFLIKEKHDTTVINAQLDDRLGVYIMLDILPKMGIEFDLLLTEGEEEGHSTAAYFESQKEYNWMFSFDRRLNDVVMYQYENAELTNDLKQAGFKAGHGTFSDIDFLGHLGIRGFNVGTGYNWEHDKLCHASMHMMVQQINRFAKFYSLFQDKAYPYTAQTKRASYVPIQWYQDTCYLCERVSPKGEDINDVWICDDCLVSALECPTCGDIVKDTDIINDMCSYCQNRSAG